MKYTKIITGCIGLFLCLGSVIPVNAQLDSSDFHFQLQKAVDDHSTLTTDTLFFHKLEVHLNDTVNVGRINVKAGTTAGSGNVVDYSFEFDKTSFLPEGYSYYRKEDTVYLTLSKHPADTYYYEIKLIDEYGSATLPKTYTLWD